MNEYKVTCEVHKANIPGVGRISLLNPIKVVARASTMYKLPDRDVADGDSRFQQMLATLLHKKMGLESFELRIRARTINTPQGVWSRPYESELGGEYMPFSERVKLASSLGAFLQQQISEEWRNIESKK